MKRDLVILVLVVSLMAIGARAFLYHWENIFGIDSYWFARHGKYVLLNGELPERDPLYSYNFEHPPIPKELSFYLPAWYYKIRFGEEYNREQWFIALKDLSTFFGVIGSLSMALLAFYVGGPLAGILSGTLAATNPGYVYRSMAGFYEDDAVGLALFLLGVFLFVEGVRRRDWKFLLLSSISWLGVAVAWKAYELVVYTLLLSIGLFIAREIALQIGSRFPITPTIGAILTAIGAIVVWLLFRSLAIGTAVNTLESVGTLSTDINSVGAATLLVLGTHPLIPVLMGLMAYFLTLHLITKEKKWFYFSLASLLLAIPFYMVSATAGFKMTVTLEDGRERIIGYGEAYKEVGGNIPGVDLYQMIFGSIIVVFVAQVIGSFAATTVVPKRYDRREWIYLLGGTVLVLLVGLLSVFYNGYNWIEDFLGGNVPLLEQRYGVIGATVVEERYGYFFWSPKFSILAVFTLFAVPFLIYKRRPEYLIILAVFGLTLYLAWIKLKTNYYFGAPLGLVAGLVLADLWNRGKKEWILTIYIIIVFALLATGIFHTVGRVPTLLYPEEAAEALTIAPITSDTFWMRGPDYLATFEFIEKNTEKNAAIFNWWGLGHWLAFFTERYLATDNTNVVFKANQYVAETFLSPWEEGIRRVQEKNYDYILWSRDYIYGYNAFLLYAYGFRAASQLAPDYLFYITQPCKPVTGLYDNYYNCGDPINPIFVEKNIIERAPSVFLAPLPFEELPKFKGYGVYKIEDRLVLVTEKMNRSFMFLLWKGGNERVKPVYVSPTGYLILYRVS